jgi:hypothetical protein
MLVMTSQPALNFGYARADDAEPWRQRPDAPARPLEASGTAVAGGRVETGAFGYGVFALEPS